MVASNHDKNGDLICRQGDHNANSCVETCSTKCGKIYDPVFGHLDQEGPKFRNVTWVGATFVMLKAQIGIGVLSIPGAVSTLGLVPAVIVLFIVAIMTTWSAYVVGSFKVRHPEVYGLDDAGYIMFGRVGKELFALGFCLNYIFVSGSSMLGVSIGLNALSSHGACTAIFVAVAAVAAFALSSIRTLSKLSWLAGAGTLSVLISVFTVTVAVGVQDRPAAAPKTGPLDVEIQILGHPSFAEAMAAIATLVLAFGGIGSFLPIVSEMKDPKHYVRSMLTCQITMLVVYLVVGLVVYAYCGSYVATPALGSAGTLMKKVCYGLGLPGLVVTSMLLCHLPAKYFFVRMLRGTKHLTANTFTHWATWFGCTGGVATLAYIIASSVPKFGSLVALIGALLGTFISLQPMGCMWLYDNYRAEKAIRGKLHWVMFGSAIFVIIAGTFCMVGGTYGAIVQLIEDYSGQDPESAWSCKDNSEST